MVMEFEIGNRGILRAAPNGGTAFIPPDNFGKVCVIQGINDRRTYDRMEESGHRWVIFPSMFQPLDGPW